MKRSGDRAAAGPGGIDRAVVGQPWSTGSGVNRGWRQPGLASTEAGVDRGRGRPTVVDWVRRRPVAGVDRWLASTVVDRP
jgi:hypothetical protein